VSFAAITLCVASQQVFIVVVYFIINSVWKLSDTPSYISMVSYPIMRRDSNQKTDYELYG
jgi:hypothetical protein